MFLQGTEVPKHRRIVKRKFSPYAKIKQVNSRETLKAKAPMTG